MSFQQLVLVWTSAWRYDYWWRQKYQVPFNSERHREISQIDVKFEYVEQYLANKEYKRIEEDKKLKEKEGKLREDQLFDQIKI